MSRTGKTVLWIIVVLIVLYVGWMLLNKPADDTSTLPANAVSSQTDQGASVTTNQNASTVSSPSDTTDPSITNDTASIDAQMKGLDSDTTASAAGSDAQ